MIIFDNTDMKFFYIIISLIFIAACNGPELADPITVDLNGNMTASINGTAWESGPNNSASVNFQTNKIHIEGFQNVDGIIRNHIKIIVEETSTGTFNSQVAKGVYYDVQNKKTYISENDCSVNITELNNEARFISGSFSFNAIDLNSGESIEALKGEFNKVNLSTVE